jgi:hypothetical protein
MIDFNDIADELVSLSDASSGSYFKRPLDDTTSVVMEWPSKSDVKLLSLAKETSDAKKSEWVETLLRVSYYECLSSNVVGALSCEERLSLVQPYIYNNRFDQNVAADLNAMQAIFDTADTLINNKNANNKRIDQRWVHI